MKFRSRIVLFCFAAFWLGLVTRMVFLSIFPNPVLAQTHRRQFESEIVVKPRRGTVFDRNGNELAASITTYSLFADPSLIKSPKKVSRRIAAKLGLSANTIYSKIKKKDRRFTWIHRYLSKEIADEIIGWKVRGLSFVREYKRIYPNESVLGPVLGFVGADQRGLEGIEGFFESHLSGEAKVVKILRDAKGRPLLGDSGFMLEHPVGKDVKLTIEKELQYELEQQLTAALERHEAETAVGIVLDVKTSQILAMASLPSFNPNSPEGREKTNRRNWTITGAFEQGSTLKVVPVAAALNEGLLHPNTRIDCEGGEIKIGKHTVKEADVHHRFDNLTVAEVLAKSSNVGTTKIAFQLGEDLLAKYLKNFGFGERTGIEFWGESKGLIRPRPWKKIELSNISFGHGVSATPLQVANAFAAIANGGVLNRPYLVQSIIDPTTGDEIKTQVQPIRKVVQPEVARHLRLMLTAATGVEGTGGKARVAGYLVGGKTGTAQKVNPTGRGYLKGSYISSFAGFFPAEEPTHVVYIAIDSPKKGYYGSDVAAPVFSKIASFILRARRVNPILISQNEVIPNAKVVNTVIKQTLTGDTVPELKGLTLREVISTLRGSPISAGFVGNGVVQAVFPAPGESLPKSKRIQVVLGSNDEQ
jgi:cell division protein FtsI (penicillin-binding protein 3)